MNRTDVYKDIESKLGLVPTFFKTLPDSSLQLEWDLMQRVQSNTQLRNLFTSRSVSSLLDAFLLLGYTGLMLAYNPFLGGVILLFA